MMSTTGSLSNSSVPVAISRSSSCPIIHAGNATCALDRASIASNASSRYAFIPVDVMVSFVWKCSSRLSWNIFRHALACSKPRVFSSRIFVASLCWSGDASCNFALTGSNCSVLFLSRMSMCVQHCLQYIMMNCRLLPRRSINSCGQFSGAYAGASAFTSLLPWPHSTHVTTLTYAFVPALLNSLQPSAHGCSFFSVAPFLVRAGTGFVIFIFSVHDMKSKMYFGQLLRVVIFFTSARYPG